MHQACVWRWSPQDTESIYSFPLFGLLYLLFVNLNKRGGNTPSKHAKMWQESLNCYVKKAKHNYYNRRHNQPYWARIMNPWLFAQALTSSICNNLLSDNSFASFLALTSVHMQLRSKFSVQSVLTHLNDANKPFAILQRGDSVWLVMSSSVSYCMWRLQKHRYVTKLMGESVSPKVL